MKEVYLKRYEKNYRRLHRNNGHMQFLTECKEKNVVPNFTWISPQIIKQLNLNAAQIKSHRFDQLKRKLQEEIEKNHNLKSDLNHLISTLCSLIHHDPLKIIIKNIKNKIIKSEKYNDNRRNRKLGFLLQNLTPTNKPAQIKIINFTKENVIIPDSIQKFSHLAFHCWHPI